jgi:hypothetical protein
MEDKALDKVQYVDLAVDIHHVFPQKWCNDNGIDDEHRESIVNKTTISARTNRTIGGAAPSSYLTVIESRAQIKGARLDELLATHLIAAEYLRADAFDTYFAARRESLCQLVEAAIGKAVQRDIDQGFARKTPPSSSPMNSWKARPWRTTDTALPDRHRMDRMSKVIARSPSMRTLGDEVIGGPASAASSKLGVWHDDLPGARCAGLQCG